MKKVLILICIAGLLLGTCACAGRNAKNIPLDKNLDELIEKEVHHAQNETDSSNEVFEEAHKILGVRKGDLKGDRKDKCYTVYFVTLYGVYSKNGNKFEEKSSGYNPAAIVFRKGAEEYVFIEYWQPQDGAYYTEDLKATFPSDIYKDFRKMEETAESHNEVVAGLNKQIQQKLAQAKKEADSDI